VVGPDGPAALGGVGCVEGAGEGCVEGAGEGCVEGSGEGCVVSAIIGSAEGCDWRLVTSADSAGHGFANDRCRCPGRARTGWTTKSIDIGVNFNLRGGSDPAHAELMPMPMVNNAMASADAAVAKAFATVVRLHILMFPSQKGVDLHM